MGSDDSHAHSERSGDVFRRSVNIKTNLSNRHNQKLVMPRGTGLGSLEVSEVSGYDMSLHDSVK